MDLVLTPPNATSGFGSLFEPSRRIVRNTGETGVEALSQAERQGRFSPPKLSNEEQAAVARLKQADREVRAHEQAHTSAGGPYVRGAAAYEYQKGPDGQQYAVAGEVSIDTSPADSPEATIAKMRIVQRAALAPVDPSPQDRSVASQAARVEAEAQRELLRTKESTSRGSNTDPASRFYQAAASDPDVPIINVHG